MPAITITSVDAATDKLTATAHGLLTGDRCRVRNVGGALPTGLAATTDYFAIRDTADVVKLATSNANALAIPPIVVDITGAGSGTNTLEYGLPYCLPTVLPAPMTQMRSADLSATYNAVAALHALFTGGSQSIWTGQGGTRKKTFAPVITNNVLGLTWTLNAGDFIKSTGAGDAHLLVPAEVGDRIIGLELLAFGDGAVDATITLSYLSNAMVQTSMGALTDTNRAAAWDFAVVTPNITPHTIVDGERLRLSVNANAANYQVGAIKLLYDRPNGPL